GPPLDARTRLDALRTARPQHKRPPRHLGHEQRDHDGCTQPRRRSRLRGGTHRRRAPGVPRVGRTMRPASNAALVRVAERRDPGRMTKWEYIVVPLEEVGGLKKRAQGLEPERLNELGQQGWEAVGLTLKKGDLVAWPVVLLKRPVE